MNVFCYTKDVNHIWEIIKLCVQRIKDEALLFTVVAILLIVSFPDLNIVIFIIYVIGIIVYAVITGIRISNHKTDNRFLSNANKFLDDQLHWETRTINNSDVYFYSNDNNYKIVQSDNSIKDWEPGIESWMRNFPDSYVSEWQVYLKYGEIVEYRYFKL
jgi:hypothetical protein